MFYQSYNCGIIKCEIIHHSGRANKLVVTHLQLSNDTNTLTPSLALEENFGGKCSVLGVQEVELDGSFLLIIEVKEMVVKKSHYEYHTISFNDTKRTLDIVKTFRLNCDISRDCFKIAPGPLLLFAYDTSLISLDVRFDSVSVMKAVFERRVFKLLYASKNEGTSETTLLASIKASAGNDLAEVTVYVLIPSSEKQSQLVCSKCPTSKYIPEHYTTMVSALLYRRNASREVVVAATNFQQLLLFENGHLVRCEQLDLKGSQIIKLQEFENLDNRRVCVLKSNKSGVILIDYDTFKEVGRFSNVQDVLTDDFLLQGSEQALLIYSSHSEQHEVSIVDGAAVNIIAPDDSQVVDNREEYESFGSAVHALNSRLQAGRHSIDTSKLELQLKDTMCVKETERLNEITSYGRSNMESEIKMHLVDFFDEEGGAKCEAMEISGVTDKKPSVAVGRIWHKTYKDSWIVAANVKNTSNSDMCSVTLAIVEYGEHGHLFVEAYNSTNRMFSVESRSENILMEWELQSDSKRRKLEEQRCVIHMKNKLFLKSGESAVVTSECSVPKLFACKDKHFNAIVFWQFKSTSTSGGDVDRSSLQNTYNQSIGNVTLSVHSVIDSELEVALTSTSSE